MVMHRSDGRSDEQRLNNKAGVVMEIGFPRNHRLAKEMGGQFSGGGRGCSAARGPAESARVAEHLRKCDK